MNETREEDAISGMIILRIGIFLSFPDEVP